MRLRIRYFIGGNGCVVAGAESLHRSFEHYTAVGVTVYGLAGAFWVGSALVLMISSIRGDD